eukprot:scaffold69906_cov63-Phaeocystis_antarctica.AAC.2
MVRGTYGTAEARTHSSTPPGASGPVPLARAAHRRPGRGQYGGPVLYVSTQAATAQRMTAAAVAGRPVGRPIPGSAELPRAARSDLSRRRSRPEALPRPAL